MAMFKGFSQGELLTGKSRLLIAVLSEQLALTNKALETMSEEVKALREEVRSLKKIKE